MKTSAKTRAIPAARQALIVQRVLVDGWQIRDVAAAYAVEERRVEAWVVAYRRHGMASLRQAPSRSLWGEMLRLKLHWPLTATFHRLCAGLRYLIKREPPARLAPLRRSREERP